MPTTMATLRAQNFSDIFTASPDPRVENWFFMGSHLNPIVSILVYFLLVFKIVPSFMENRKPFKLHRFIIAFNLGQILVNSYIFSLGVRHFFFTFKGKINLWCDFIDESSSPESMNIITMHYYYMLLKYFDFLETVVYCLRKKDRQVSFLHVFHHVGLALTSWYSLNYFPGGTVVYCAGINLYVHIVMYIYYLMSSTMDPKYLWWKKYLTLLQLAQHYIIFGLLLLPLINPNCPYPKWYLLLLEVFAVMIIYLFTTFYIKNYVKSKNQ